MRMVKGRIDWRYRAERAEAQISRLTALLEDRTGLEYAICQGAGDWAADDSETKSEAEHIADRIRAYLKEQK
jgi:hypothetical protein